MQNFLLVFVLAALLPLSATSAQDPIYTIQLGTFTDTKLSDFEGIQPLGFLYADQVGSNMFRLFMGGYTTQSFAENTITTLRQRGYLDAKLVELNTDDGSDVYVIQLAIRNRSMSINWKEFSEAEQLYVLLQNDLVKIVEGTYAGREQAQERVLHLRERGFPDAFVKQTNAALIHPVTDFHSEGIELSNRKGSTQSPKSPVSAPSDDAIPDSYEASVVLPSRSAELELELGGNSFPEPEIRGNLKRSAVLELQKQLRTLGHYSSTLDGLYGTGTAGAYERAVQENSQVEKYRVLGQMGNLRSAEPVSSLQAAINELAFDPVAALQTLNQSDHAGAKIYRAYYLFETQGSSQEVNQLMNEAIRKAFDGRSNPNILRFDPNASYAYNTREQLLLHMRFVHQVSPAISIPCWMFRRHVSSSIEAFGTDVGASAPGIEDCGDLFDWPALSTLIAMARDMGSAKLSAEQLEGVQERKIRLLLAPAPLSASSIDNLKMWSENMHEGVQAWSAKDPMLSQLGEAFQLTFLQSQILLEDYFMDKSFDAAQAQGLALATLQAMLGLHLERFI